jgi:hypothetical protein
MAAFLILEPRSVFLHVPKTGGASIRHGFFKNQYEGPCQGSIPDEWADLFKFGFVRNPFDRLISAWQMFAQGMENTVWEHPGQECKDISLADFLDIAMDESIPYDGVRSTVPRKIRHHALPQTHPFHCIDQADFIGRFERLEDDFQELLDRLGIPRQPLNHMNRTRRCKKTMDYFDPATWQRAVDFYAQDFDKLGYDVTEL